MIKRVRVVLLTNFIPPYRLPLYKAIAERVGELHVLLSTPMEPNRAWPLEWSNLNVIVQRNITFRRTWRHPQGFTEPLYIHLPYDMLYRLGQDRPDVIISGELGLRTLQAVLYRRLYSASRVIAWVTLSEHTEQNRGRLRNALRRWLLTQVDAIIVNGTSGARYLHSCGVPHRKVFCLPNTVDTAQFAALPLTRTSAQAHRLLYVGQLIARKGLDTLLNQLDRWAASHPTCTLECWLAGDGPMRSSFERMLLSPNLKLRFLGNVPYTLMPQVYAQAGILVFPTLSDPWGLVVNEALSAGLPVLGSRYSQAVEDLIRDSETGWTFRPDDAEEVSTALEQALNTPSEKLELMRQAARARVENITPETVAQGFIQAIQYVTRHHSQRA